MKTLTHEKELQIIKAAERIVDLVNNGSKPNDALYKVATDCSLTPEFVKRLAETFNTSRMLAHFKTASSNDRANEFPLANAGDVLDKMYPDKDTINKESGLYSKCHSTWFGPPPSFSNTLLAKTASISRSTVSRSTECRDVELLIKRANNYKDSLSRKVDVAKEDTNYCREMVHRSIIKVGEYFQSVDHAPFEAIESNALTKFGSKAKSAMNAAFIACRGAVFGEKRGKAYDTDRIFNASVKPYDSINDAIQWAEKWASSTFDRQSAERELDEFKTEWNKRFSKLSASEERSVPFPFDFSKSSGSVLNTLVGGSIVSSKLGDMFKPDDDFEDDVRMSDDPTQVTKLRAIRSKALLNELMSSDPVISGYDPNAVLKAFNEISLLAPRVSDQPAMLRGLLSRQLELGRTEPFEAGQVVDTEKSLKQTEGMSSGE